MCSAVPTCSRGIPFIKMDDPSKYIFALADGHPAAGSNIAKLYHNVREPSRTVYMVPALADNSLLSGEKFADAGYMSILDGNEVNLYDGKSVKITVSEEAVLKGWRCPPYQDMAYTSPKPHHKSHHSNTPPQWTHGCRFKKPKVCCSQYSSLP